MLRERMLNVFVGFDSCFNRDGVGRSRSAKKKKPGRPPKNRLKTGRLQFYWAGATERPFLPGPSLKLPPINPAGRVENGAAANPRGQFWRRGNCFRGGDFDSTTLLLTGSVEPEFTRGVINLGGVYLHPS
jgi:hypothetical protein